MDQSVSNRISGDVLRGWVLRAFAVGLALGLVAAIVALLN